MKSVAILLLVVGVCSAQWWPYNYGAWNGLNNWNNWNGQLGNPGFYNWNNWNGVTRGRAFAYSTTGLAPLVAPVPAAPIVPAYTKTQYQSQDETGAGSFGYAYPGQAASQARDSAGNVQGSYAYIDPNGKEVRVNYVADAGGFRAESNALPVGPSPLGAVLVGPSPVQDTPEVQAARAEHLRAIEEVKNRPGQNIEETHTRRKRALLYSYTAPAGPVLAASPIAYHHSPALAGPVLAASPIAYHHSPALAPITYAAAPAILAHHRPAVLTTVVNNPGHAVSYRVD